MIPVRRKSSWIGFGTTQINIEIWRNALLDQMLQKMQQLHEHRPPAVFASAKLHLLSS